MKLPDFPYVVRKGNSKVTIYRHSNKGYDEFKVAFYDPNKLDSKGNPRRIMETFADFADAKARADGINGSVNNGAVRCLSLTGEERLAYIRAMDDLKPLGLPLEVAVRHFVESVKVLGEDRVLEASKYFAKKHPKAMEAKFTPDVFNEFIAQKKANGLSEVYLEDLRYRCGSFAKSFVMPVFSITGADIQRFLDGLKLSPRSYNNFLGALRTFFQFAKKKKYLPLDWDEISAVEPLKEKAGEIEIYSPQELQRLLSAADDQFLPVLVIGAFAGIRSAEIERLEWSEIRLKERVIVIDIAKSKTQSRRLAPITDNLAQWLAPYAQLEGKVWKHSHAYLHEVQRETANATKGDETGEKPVEWKHNALRHSFISYRVAETQNVPQVALEAGNSPKMIFSNYRELVTKEQAKEWFSIYPQSSGISFLPSSSVA